MDANLKTERRFLYGLMGRGAEAIRAIPEDFKIGYLSTPGHREILGSILSRHQQGLDVSSPTIYQNLESAYRRDFLDIEAGDTPVEWPAIPDITQSALTISSEATKRYGFIDCKLFQPLSVEELLDILGITIKSDNTNKLFTFFAMLSAYSESAQLNISYNSPSSTGKSYLPLEIAHLFPQEDVIQLGYSSPTAFFHDHGQFDLALGGYRVDLSRRILIFLDQPNQDLLQRLRPLLSHDCKTITSKITDKSQKHGLKTKTINLIGFPTVMFCTASLRLDEQEATRFILLSPESSQQKLRAAICEKVRREADSDAYHKMLDEDPRRRQLQHRLRAIKNEYIVEINLCSQELVERVFLKQHGTLKPRHQRDVGHIIKLIKAWALLNLWFRERRGTTIIANEEDIDVGFKLWEAIRESQDLNLPPYVFQVFQEVIEPEFERKNASNPNGSILPGLNRREICAAFYRRYQRPISEYTLRTQIIPMLETAGLIAQEQDPDDKRSKLVYLIRGQGRLEVSPMDENNSERTPGVSDSLPIEAKW